MYEPKIESAELDRLFAAILKLKNKEECYRFFQDLCSYNELNSFGQRYEVARMLHQGLTYQNIEQATKCSTATISRINRCLLYGEGGYRLALDREEQPSL